MQTLLLTVLLLGTLPLFFGALGVATHFPRLSIISAAAAVVFWYLRRWLNVGVWVAAPAALLFLLHPLWVVQTVGVTDDMALLPVLLVPLAFAAIRQVIEGLGIRASVLLGAILGTGLAIDLGAGTLLLAAAGVYAMLEVSLANQPQAVLRQWRKCVVLAGLAAIVAAVVALGLPGVLVRMGVIIPENDGGSGMGLHALTAPFALVDREGLLAQRLGAVPSDLTTGGGAGYLGWSVLVLCLIAVWPNRGADAGRTRRIAALLILALGLLWLLRGPDSLHAQLRRMFEFATVKRYIEPLTLHLLGLLTIPLLALPLLVFLALGRLCRRRPGWTIGSIIAASAVAMLWWGTSPATLPGPAASLADATRGSAMLTALLVFPLVCGTAAGLQRLCAGARTRLGRLAMWFCVLALLAADVFGPARRAIDRTTNPAAHACAARTYGQEREDAPRFHCRAQ